MVRVSFTDNFNTKITYEYIKKAESLGYSFDEMLTLASIIQKECDFDIDECKNVSSVFHNRLKASKSTYLGSDVTYFYLKNKMLVNVIYCRKTIVDML